MTERTLSSMRFEFDEYHEYLRLLALGALTGGVAGMGSFMYIKKQLLPWGIEGTWALVLVGVAGAYAHLLADDLAESISLSLVAVVVGLAVHTAAWIAPLWILPFHPAARDLLLPQMLGDALMSSILAFLMTFYAAYFVAVFVWGYLKP